MLLENQQEKILYNMSPYQLQYKDQLKKLLSFPRKISGSRVGNINSLFCEQMRVDLRMEFPLMEIKKIKFENVLHELLWMINGDTNIKYLVENNCGIWNKDSYRYFLEKYYDEFKSLEFPVENENDFIKLVSDNYEFYSLSNGKRYYFGDLDKIYGYQWRRFNNDTDQLKICIDKLKNNPDDRRIIVTAHNPSDIENNMVGLPSCHNYFQFYTEIISNEMRKHTAMMKNVDINDIPERYISLYFNKRSSDHFLGEPYNIVQYSLLLHIIANIVDMLPFEVVVNSVDSHLYHEHFDAAKIFLKRCEIYEFQDYYCKSELVIKEKISDIDNIKPEIFEIKNYLPLSYIKAPLLA